MNTFAHIFLAVNVGQVHADASKNQSALMCMDEARKLLLDKPAYAMKWIERSLRHSVGVFHRDCQMAINTCANLPV